MLFLTDLHRHTCDLIMMTYIMVSMGSLTHQLYTAINVPHTPPLHVPALTKTVACDNAYAHAPVKRY